VLYSVDFKGQAAGVSSTVSSDPLSVLPGDVLTICGAWSDNARATAWTVANDGTSIAWVKQAETNTASNTKVVMWSGIAGAVPPTSVSVTTTAGTATNTSVCLSVMVHTGATDVANVTLGSGAVNVAQPITPVGSGSALWFFCSDWNQSNTYTQITGCTQVNEYFEATKQRAQLVRPTTQPRADATPFTIGTNSTGGPISWVAFEVPAAVVATTGAGEYESKRKRRYVTKIGNQLVVIPDPSVLDLLDDEPTEPIQVPVKEIKAKAKVYNLDKEIAALLKAKDYEQALRIHEDLQDEEDVEMLLLSL
jgi:hypothetical protein